MASILIVDDEVDIRGLLSDILSDEGYTVFQASNAAAAIATFNENHIDLAIVDIWLEGSELDGIGVLKRVKSTNPNIPIIMISGHGNIETAVQTIKLGAYDFIEKPFKTEKILIMITRALNASQLLVENKALKKSLGQYEFIGDSKQIHAIKAEVENIAPTKSRILIFGEQGVGKEALARYIHQTSNRKNRAFTKIICSSITAQNFNNELLGTSSSHGILEQTNGGTIFFDEIGNLDLESQNRLLKILQENTFQKNNKKITLDIRVISSSTTNLLEKINNGEFSQSLFYRINVIPITIPPLKERKADIKALSNLFIKHIAESQNLPPIDITENAFTQLELHQWPGNVRQLKNLIEWLMIMFAKKGQQITSKMLPNDLNIHSDNDNAATAERPLVQINSDLISKPLRIARDIFEKAYLKAQLSRFSGNISETAKFVGMERTALHRKIKALKVENDN